MASGVLVIGPTEAKNIKKAIESARAKPIPWEVLQEVAVDNETNTLLLNERKNPGRTEVIRSEYPSHHVQLGTCLAAISFEEQPAGLFRHLSVSSDRPDMVPNEHALRMVSKAFGFSGFPPTRPYRVWVEEFKPGHMAVNIIELEP